MKGLRSLCFVRISLLVATVSIVVFDPAIRWLRILVTREGVGGDPIEG